MKIEAGQWLEIFQSGNYGARGSYTASDLDKIVGNFNLEDKVPIVVGTPQNDSPAWGWLSEIKRAGEFLFGRVGELHEDFERAFSEGRFRKLSVRIGQTVFGPKILHLEFSGNIFPVENGLRQRLSTQPLNNFDIYSPSETIIESFQGPQRFIDLTRKV